MSSAKICFIISPLIHLYIHSFTGYPRNVSQAQSFLDLCQHSHTDRPNPANSTVIVPKVIHIDLAESVVKAKLLGRRACSTCHRSFNLADVMSDGYDMPAILPHANTCPKGTQHCNPVLVSRKDDVPEVIDTRIAIYNEETRPILKYFSDRGLLTNFAFHEQI